MQHQQPARTPGSAHVYTYEIQRGDLLYEEHRDAHTMAILTTVLVVLYMIFAVVATLNVHVEWQPSTLCKHMFRCRKQRRTALGKYPRRNDTFFLVLHCFLVLPLVQLICVWRVHRSAHATEPSLMVWAFVLVLGLVFFMMSIVFASRRTYYLHTAVSMQLTSAMVFAAEGMSRMDTSGDILVASIMFTLLTMHVFNPPLVLRENSELVKKERRRVEQAWARRMYRKNSDGGGTDALSDVDVAQLSDDDTSVTLDVDDDDLFGGVFGTRPRGLVPQPRVDPALHTAMQEMASKHGDRAYDLEKRETYGGVLDSSDDDDDDDDDDGFYVSIDAPYRGAAPPPPPPRRPSQPARVFTAYPTHTKHKGRVGVVHNARRGFSALRRKVHSVAGSAKRGFRPRNMLWPEDVAAARAALENQPHTQRENDALAAAILGPSTGVPPAEERRRRTEEAFGSIASVEKPQTHGGGDDDDDTYSTDVPAVTWLPATESGPSDESDEESASNGDNTKAGALNKIRKRLPVRIKRRGGDAEQHTPMRELSGSFIQKYTEHAFGGANVRSRNSKVPSVAEMREYMEENAHIPFVVASTLEADEREATKADQASPQAPAAPAALKAPSRAAASAANGRVAGRGARQPPPPPPRPRPPPRKEAPEGFTYAHKVDMRNTGMQRADDAARELRVKSGSPPPPPTPTLVPAALMYGTSHPDFIEKGEEIESVEILDD